MKAEVDDRRARNGMAARMFCRDLDVMAPSV
jgi:hypothetical protein